MKSLSPRKKVDKDLERLQRKLIEPKSLEKAVAKIREEKKTIATLNGSFDLLHAGHLYIIHEAAKQADVCFVLLNTDESIARYKGKNRPIVPLQYRLELIAALEFVDSVSFFGEDDPCEILSKIRPDVHVNGAEYGKDCVEAKTVQSFGGRVHLVDRIPSLSTSAIVEKIQSMGTKCA